MDQQTNLFVSNLLKITIIAALLLLITSLSYGSIAAYSMVLDMKSISAEYENTQSAQNIAEIKKTLSVGKNATYSVRYRDGVIKLFSQEEYNFRLKGMMKDIPQSFWKKIDGEHALVLENPKG
jgi:hypothetical protein